MTGTLHPAFRVWANSKRKLPIRTSFKCKTHISGQDTMPPWCRRLNGKLPPLVTQAFSTRLVAGVFNDHAAHENTSSCLHGRSTLAIPIWSRGTSLKPDHFIWIHINGFLYHSSLLVVKAWNSSRCFFFVFVQCLSLDFKQVHFAPSVSLAVVPQ